MMSNKLNHYYLNAMGIDVWLQRHPEHTCEKQLVALAKEVASCTRCPLYHTRKQTVFSRGHSKAKLMIIGEAPGVHDDEQGLPFVGPAGDLLNHMIKSIGMTEEDVYIVNILKCRPPNPRDPEPNEVAPCSHYLTRQIELIQPHLILAVGCFAGQFLMNKLLPLETMRNSVHNYSQIPFIVTYHPVYLLSNPVDKKKAYYDLLAVKRFFMEKNSSF